MAAIPDDDAGAKAISFWDRIAARIKLIKKPLPVLPAAEDFSNTVIGSLHYLIVNAFLLKH